MFSVKSVGHQSFFWKFRMKGKEEGFNSRFWFEVVISDVT